jgi:RND family efflux transporter MFP subunit
MKILKRILTLAVIGIIVAGMVMVLQNNKANSEAKAKSVTPRPFAVSVTQVESRELSSSLVLVGTILPNREVTVSSETQGRLRAVANNIGQFKSAGSVLAQVDDELKRTAVQMAEVTLEKARKDLERLKQVQTENAIPEQSIDNAVYAVETAEVQLATARRQLRDARITVPFSGVVSAKFAEVGGMVSPGTPIASIVDISTLKVKLNVSETDVLSMKLGDQVEVTSDVHPGTSIIGRITTIGAKADEAHTYVVEVSIPNRADRPLKAGMFGRVAFNADSRHKSLVIPRTAIVGSVKKPQVFVASNGVVKLRDISTGTEVGTDIEVTGGISQGESIVISGQNNLRDNMAVEVMKSSK